MGHMNQGFLIIFISASAIAATPDSYSFQRGRPSVPTSTGAAPSAKPVLSESNLTVVAPKADRPETPVSGINSFNYKQNKEGQIVAHAKNPRPAPKGCGFFGGAFSIDTCKRRQSKDGAYVLQCTSFYTKTVEGILWNSEKKFPVAFELKDPAIEAYLCSKATKEDRVQFQGTGTVVRNTPISQGLRVCDGAGQLYDAKDPQKVNVARFNELAGPTLIDALKTQANDYVALKGKSAEELLASCSASKSKPAQDYVPVKPKQTETEIAPMVIPRGGPNRYEKDSFVEEKKLTLGQPNGKLPPPEPVVDANEKPLKAKGSR